MEKTIPTNEKIDDDIKTYTDPDNLIRILEMHFLGSLYYHSQ